MHRDELMPPVEKAVAALKATGAREVYLFGSATTGMMGKNSDVDLAVSGLRHEVFLRAMAKAVAP